jgi:hypothetical protein
MKDFLVVLLGNESCCLNDVRSHGRALCDIRYQELPCSEATGVRSLLFSEE